MQFINAAGENSDFVCILAIKQMPEESWHVEEVPGLSINSRIGGKGYLYFTHTRCRTVDMWRDYFLRVVIPFIRQSNEFYKPWENSESPTRNFFSTDREDIIISNAFDESLAADLEKMMTAEHLRVSLTSECISNYIEGLCCLVHVLGIVLKPTMVRRGFSCCGQDCEKDANGCTVDFAPMLL